MFVDNILVFLWEYFDQICTLAAGFLAVISFKEYRFIAFLVFFEFSLHLVTYNYILLDIRSDNSSIIYLLYTIIQCLLLGIMNKFQVHRVIGILIFINLSYNFFTTLQHLGIFMYFGKTHLNFHAYYKSIIGTIMILELFYLVGITSYVWTHFRKYKFLDINYIDNIFLVSRFIPSWDMGWLKSRWSS